MKRIRELRTERGLSQAKLAVMADMDPATLNRLEQGKGNPNLRTLERVADALDITVAELLEESPKAARRSPQLSLNDVLDEERRRSRFANAITAAGDEWIRAAARPDVNTNKFFGIVEAAFTLHDSISAPFNREGEWEKLTNPERQELIAVLEKLNEVATSVLRQIEKTTEAVDQAEKAKHNREKIREWTRRISA